MAETRITVRGDNLRDQVNKERERLREEQGLDLSISQTAAHLIRMGLLNLGAPRQVGSGQ